MGWKSIFNPRGLLMILSIPMLISWLMQVVEGIFLISRVVDGDSHGSSDRYHRDGAFSII